MLNPSDNYKGKEPNPYDSVKLKEEREETERKLSTIRKLYKKKWAKENPLRF
jgi:hypothetical protein